MSPTVELVNGRLRQFFCVKREVREGHHLVVAAVVEEHWKPFGKLRGEVLWQRILFDLPALRSYVGRRDKEQPRNRLLHCFLGEVPEKDESAYGVPDQDHLAVQRGEFSRDRTFPSLGIGAGFIRHPRTPHVKCSPECIL